MKKLIVPVFISIATLCSCKKETAATVTPTEPAIQPKKIKSLSYVYDNGAPENKTLTYDAQGRVSAYNTSSTTETFLYQSPTALLVTRKLLSNNSTDRTIECTLNDKGAITMMVFKNTAGQVTYTYTYTYNADGYMIAYKGDGGSSNYENVFEISGNNLRSVKVYFNGVHTYNDIYSTSSTGNSIAASFGGYWPVPFLFGKPFKNMVSEMKEYKTATGELHWHTKNTYQQNSAGYITKNITEFVTSGNTGVTAYELE